MLAVLAVLASHVQAVVASLVPSALLQPSPRLRQVVLPSLVVLAVLASLLQAVVPSLVLSVVLVPSLQAVVPSLHAVVLVPSLVAPGLVQVVPSLVVVQRVVLHNRLCWQAGQHRCQPRLRYLLLAGRSLRLRCWLGHHSIHHRRGIAIYHSVHRAIYHSIHLSFADAGGASPQDGPYNLCVLRLLLDG